MARTHLVTAGWWSAASGVATGRWDDSEANIGAPGNRVEFNVGGANLTNVWLGDDELIETLDRVLVHTDSLSLPAPGDVVAVVDDIEGVHDRDSGRVFDAGCFVCVSMEYLWTEQEVLLYVLR